MNPDERWAAPTPAAAQPQPTTAPYQPQYPGESSYLPQPDFGGHPAMRATLPPADHKHLRRIAALVMASVFVVAIGATLLILHLDGSTRQTTHKGAATATQTANAATDSQHRHDLKAVQNKIEAYFAKAGRYPLLSELNSPDWVSKNMPGLMQAAAADAKASRLVFASKPTRGQYAYQVYADAAGTSCANQSARCIVYVLTATLSDGSTYVLRSATA